MLFQMDLLKKLGLSVLHIYMLSLREKTEVACKWIILNKPNDLISTQNAWNLASDKITAENL